MFKFFRSIQIIGVCIFFCACNASKLDVSKLDIREFYSENLKLKISVSTNDDDFLILNYWPDDASAEKKEVTSNTKKNTVFYLSNISGKTPYSFFIQTKSGNKKSEVFHYTTDSVNKYIDVTFKRIDSNASSVPNCLKSGGILLNKRTAPGAAFLIDANGKIIWSHFFDNLGVRVSHFTDENSVISILGSDEDPTSYGRDIIEIDHKGDTLLHLVKGHGDFIYTPHHEVFKDKKGNVVLLFLEKRIMDFSSIGGKLNDTITGDGIQVIDRNGKQIWKWSVFDVLDPLHEKDILKNKSDWLHANSLSCDDDGNFLISFFNSGEVWKVNQKTGQVLWKFGKTGDLVCDKNTVFSQSHAFHSMSKGKYLCFDNQLETKTPIIHGYEIDESNRTVRSILNIQLPTDYFTDRMGSSYLIQDNLYLTCLSKNGKVILTDNTGKLIWGILAQKLTPYRAEFIRPNQLHSFLSVP